MEDRSEERAPVLISEEQALEILNVKRATLQRWVRQGDINCVRRCKGRVRAYYQEQIKEYADAHRNYKQVNVREQVALLLCEQRRIRRMLVVLSHHLKIPHLTADFSEKQISELYEAATAQDDGMIGVRRPDDVFVDAWIKVVPRLGVFEFRTMRRLHPNDANPWIHFLRVTEDLTRALACQRDRRDRRQDMRYLQMLLCHGFIRKAACEYTAIETPWKKPSDSVEDLLAAGEGRDQVPELLDPRISDWGNTDPRLTVEASCEVIANSVPRDQGM